MPYPRRTPLSERISSASGLKTSMCRGLRRPEDEPHRHGVTAVRTETFPGWGHAWSCSALRTTKRKDTASRAWARSWGVPRRCCSRMATWHADLSRQRRRPARRRGRRCAWAPGPWGGAADGHARRARSADGAPAPGAGWGVPKHFEVSATWPPVRTNPRAGVYHAPSGEPPPRAAPPLPRLRTGRTVGLTSPTSISGTACRSQTGAAGAGAFLDRGFGATGGVV